MKLLSKDKQSQAQVIRFLMIDSQQNTLNVIQQGLNARFSAHGKLLDDLASFEKMLNLNWDVILYQNAYDFDFDRALEFIESKGKTIPVILLSNEIQQNPTELNKAYQKGIFDIVNPQDLQQLTVSLARATTYSRLVRKEIQLTQEIDQLQQQTQNLVETTEYAVATFQEGVHVSANAQYAELFSVNDADSLIGLPLLDILQPQDQQSFKQSYKKLSRGDFSNSSFSILSQNPKVQQKQLNLQFSESSFDDEPALQLVIVTESTTVNTTSNDSAFAGLDDVAELCQQALSSQNASALVMFKINGFDSDQFKTHWNSTTLFFQALQTQLSQLAQKHAAQSTVLRIAEQSFVTVISASPAATLKNALKALAQALPSQITVGSQIFPVQLAVGFQNLSAQHDVSQIEQLLESAYQHHYNPALDMTLSLESSDERSVDDAPNLSLSTDNSAPLSVSLGESEPAQSLTFEPSDNTSTSTGIDSTNDATLDETEKSLVAQIENNSIALHFQQLYDKEDIDAHVFEVTASFEYEQKNIAFSQFDALKRNPSLAARVDRWVLIEASKRLHQFIQKCPKARILVNIHASSLQDATIQALLGKLVNLINSKYAKPLILQFNEADILMNRDRNTQVLKSIQEQGLDVAIAEFGDSIYSVNLLQQLKLAFAKLTQNFSLQLQSDEGMVELQEKIDQFREHDNNIKFLISHLDDVTAFANAWTVDVRYLQGNYYQPKQNEFVNSAS